MAVLGRELRKSALRYEILQNSSQGHHKQRQHGSSLINGAQICSNQDEFVQLYGTGDESAKPGTTQTVF